MLEEIVEHEGELEGRTYSVAYKIGIDNSNADYTLVMLAFQLGYNIAKYPENIMLAKVFRRFADEVERKTLIPVKAEISVRQQELSFIHEDKGENNDPPATC